MNKYLETGWSEMYGSILGIEDSIEGELNEK